MSLGKGSHPTPKGQGGMAAPHEQAPMHQGGAPSISRGQPSGGSKNISAAYNKGETTNGSGARNRPSLGRSRG
jgi:hypothetical protein